MFRRLGIRGKVLAVLAVPMLALVATAAAISLDSVRRYSATQDPADQARAVLTAVAVAVVLGLSLAIAGRIAREIIDPIRRLTATETAVSQEWPRIFDRVVRGGQTVDASEISIPVESSDEVGRLAEAINDVNTAFLEIAKEQAALRRSSAHE